MMHKRFPIFLRYQTVVVLACAVLAAPAAAQNPSAQTAQSAKNRASADITARLQAQAIAQAAQRAEQRAKERADKLAANGQHKPTALDAAVPSMAAAPNVPGAPKLATGQSDSPGTVPSWPANQAPSAGVPALGALADPASAVLLPTNPSHSPIPLGMTPELAIAQHIHQGLMRCELGSSVRVEADASRPGYFNVHGKGFRYRMFPVPTSTGALRLEDKKAGAVWLQLANKSMLMDQKKGRRMADECAHPDQVAFVQATQNQPPTDLFDTAGMGRPLD